MNKLKLALKDFSNSDFKITWRPFQLNTDMPLEGMNRQTYLENKFNGKKIADEAYEVIIKEGLRSGIHFQFDKIKFTPNSFASHKLLVLAHNFNKQTEVVESLFYNYFIEGINIGDYDELIKVAKLHDIFDNKTLIYLKSEEDSNNLLAEEKHARELGVKGVPCFIINKEFVLFGAQDRESFLSIFKKINYEY